MTDVLVVDDDDMVRSMLLAVMRDEGFSVREARNGREALEECERRAPELLLLDLAMPELDGYDLLRELDHRNGPWFPIIIVSGNAGISRELSPRVTAALRKPVDIEDLCREAKSALRLDDGSTD